MRKALDEQFVGAHVSLYFKALNATDLFPKYL
jgi:hypothetical protein